LPPTPSLLATAPLVAATLHDVLLHLAGLPA
jgi:hypothetical protein